MRRKSSEEVHYLQMYIDKARRGFRSSAGLVEVKSTRLDGMPDAGNLQTSLANHCAIDSNLLAYINRDSIQ